MTIFNTLISVIAISLISFVGVFTLSLNEKFLKKIIFIIVSLSVGALLGDVFIHILPETFESNLSVDKLSFFILLGIMIFFVLEKYLLWHHSHKDDDCLNCHNEKHQNNSKSLGSMIVVADGVHNFIDGIVIALAFLAGPAVGWAVTLAIILHEIPQEIGDFGLLLHSGYTKTKALMFNFISASAAIFGAVFGLIVGPNVENLIPIGLTIAAGGFIYVAGSDLIPELHKTKDPKKSLIQIFSILVGFILMYLLLFLE